MARTAIPVRLQHIRLERGRTFGDAWLGCTLGRALGLHQWCERLLPEEREAVPWATMVVVLVLAAVRTLQRELTSSREGRL